MRQGPGLRRGGEGDGRQDLALGMEVEQKVTSKKKGGVFGILYRAPTNKNQKVFTYNLTSTKKQAPKKIFKRFLLFWVHLFIQVSKQIKCLQILIRNTLWKT